MTEVIQICRTDGQTLTACRQVPVKEIFDSYHPSLSEMMPSIIAVASLMALAWTIKTISKFLGEMK